MNICRKEFAFVNISYSLKYIIRDTGKENIIIDNSWNETVIPVE